MTRLQKILLLSGVLGSIVGWVVFSTIRVPLVSSEQRAYNRNIGELTGVREVGQIFESIRPNLSAVSLQIATYGGRENTHDVIVELRERPEDAEPLRRVVVNARTFGDHQLRRFSFPPIADSAGRTYYVSLRAPDAVPGNAITVDYSNANPYRKGTTSAMVFLPNGREAPAAWEDALKNAADLTFQVTHRVTVWEYLRIAGFQRLRELVISLRREPDAYARAAKFASIGFLLAFLTLCFRGRVQSILSRPRLAPLFLGLLILLGFWFRLAYVQKLPYTNDEGFYLYDARTLLEGKLPGGDALAKAPVVVAAFALGVKIFGGSLIASRLVSVIAGLLTTLPLMFLARSLGTRRAGGIVAALWLLGSAPALFHAYGHTQPVQIFFSVTALAVLVAGLRQRRLSWIFGAGLLLGVSVMARKSSLAVGLPALVFLFTDATPFRERLRATMTFGAGVTLALALFLAMVFQLYGNVGVRYATGFDLAKTSLEQLNERGDLYATYSVKGILPFFRESLPVIFLALLAMGFSGERLLTRWGPFLSRGAWLLPLWLVWRGGLFLQRYEEAAHFSYGVWPAWVALGCALALVALFPRRRAESPVTDTSAARRFPALAAIVWFVAVGMFYAFWVKFHANYLLEFFPALVLLAGLGAARLQFLLHRRRVLTAGFVVLLAWFAYVSAQSSYHFEHTGTFHWSSIMEAAQYLRNHVPHNEPVLTGAVIIPYLSGHHVPFDAAHPTWYGYGFIEPELRNVFMASSEQMVAAVSERVRWAVLERLTEFSYLREYADIERTLDSSFVEVQTIENLSNPIRILKRCSPPSLKFSAGC